VNGLGITGARIGPSLEQAKAMRRIIAAWEVLRHGDCVGVDELAHGIAVELGKTIVLYPPMNPALQARCHELLPGEPEQVIINPPAPYLERNRAIVNDCEHLLVVPSGPEHSQPRSGTWSTYRYAQQIGRPVTVLPTS
jgi:predicted Rossmann fold nucleotide-binding protein DprA/Smf involved in DNA uptake